MNFSTNLLSLCIFNASVLGSSAFIVQPPKPSTVSQPLFSSPYGQASAVPGTQSFPTTSAPGPNISGGSLSASNSFSGDSRLGKSIWDTLSPVKVQGGSLKTWSFSSPSVERVQVLLKTEGRPLNANVELWQGPDNTPQKMNIYIEDGSLRPFSAIIETPRSQNAIAIRNTANMEFPLAACVEADVEDSSAGLAGVIQNLSEMTVPETIQGGSLKTYSFAPSVASIQILLKTDGRPLNSRVELLQGPNNNKQIMEIYTEDGLERPFYAVIESPGTGNVVRVINTAPVEFPLNARVEPYMVDEESDGGVVISDGGPRW